MNRNIDYGTSWAFNKSKDNFSAEEYESTMTKQLRFFHKKDLQEESDRHSYVKAFYLHHLLDYFRETRVNTNDIDLVFEKFIQNKVIIDITDSEENNINYREVVEDIFILIKENKKELYKDLNGSYLVD